MFKLFLIASLFLCLPTSVMAQTPNYGLAGVQSLYVVVDDLSDDLRSDGFAASAAKPGRIRSRRSATSASAVSSPPTRSNCSSRDSTATGWLSAARGSPAIMAAAMP